MDEKMVVTGSGTEVKQAIPSRHMFDEWDHPEMTVGTDPELFVVNAENDVIPAFQFLPEKNYAKKEGLHSYWDGFQAEFDFSHPHRCLEEMGWDIAARLDNVLKQARRYDPKANLSITNVFEFPAELMANAEIPHVELGCKPSYNVYGDNGTRVANPRKLLHRFAGGHMHFGTWRLVPNYPVIVNMLDSILGVWSVGAAADIDNPIRRKYYGLAGEFRKPTYKSRWHPENKTFGIEYRTLSNFWLCHPAIYHLTWDIGRLAVWFASSAFAKYWVATVDEVRQTINQCDVQKAREILERNKGVFKWLMSHKRGDWEKPWGLRHVNRAFNIGMEGVGSFIDDPTSIETNWQLGKYERGDASENPIPTFYTAVDGE